MYFLSCFSGAEVVVWDLGLLWTVYNCSVYRLHIQSQITLHYAKKSSKNVSFALRMLCDTFCLPTCAFGYKIDVIGMEVN